MGLFGNKKKVTGTYFGEPLFEDDPVNYEQALAYLVGLSDEDYVKVMDVAGIHRKAYKDSQAVLGEPVEPTTFINPPEPTPAPGEVAAPDFLDDIAPEKPKPKKVEVQ